MRVTRQPEPASQPCKNSLLYTTFLPLFLLLLLFYALLGSAQQSGVVSLLPHTKAAPMGSSSLSSSPKADKNGPGRVERGTSFPLLLLLFLGSWILMDRTMFDVRWRPGFYDVKGSVCYFWKFALPPFSPPLPSGVQFSDQNRH